MLGRLEINPIGSHRSIMTVNLALGELDRLKARLGRQGRIIYKDERVARLGSVGLTLSLKGVHVRGQKSVSLARKLSHPIEQPDLLRDGHCRRGHVDFERDAESIIKATFTLGQDKGAGGVSPCGW